MEIQAALFTLYLIGYLLSVVIVLTVTDRWFLRLNRRYLRIWYLKYLLAFADGWLHAIGFYMLVKIASLGRDTDVFNALCVFFVMFLAGFIGRLLSFRLKRGDPKLLVARKHFILAAPGLLLGIVICALPKSA